MKNWQRHSRPDEPLVKGGQGRSDLATRACAEVCAWLVLALVVIVCTALLHGCTATEGKVIPDQGASLFRP